MSEPPHGTMDGIPRPVTIIVEMSETIEDLLDKASSFSSPSLDLSQRNIRHLPEEIPFLPNLEVGNNNFLYKTCQDTSRLGI